MDLQLQNRSVLVTGGAGGIGRAIVRTYAAEGARFALTYDSNADAAPELVREVEERGGSAFAVALDLADRASIEQAMDLVASRHGGLDSLVANAVRWPTDAAQSLGDTEPDVWENARIADRRTSGRAASDSRTRHRPSACSTCGTRPHGTVEVATAAVGDRCRRGARWRRPGHDAAGH